MTETQQLPEDDTSLLDLLQTIAENLHLLVIGVIEVGLLAMAALVTGFALLLFVFIREAPRNVIQETESAQKLNEIKEDWREALGR